MFHAVFPTQQYRAIFWRLPRRNLHMFPLLFVGSIYIEHLPWRLINQQASEISTRNILQRKENLYPQQKNAVFLKPLPNDRYREISDCWFSALSHFTDKSPFATNSRKT